jgi:hypothetical protein
MKKKILWRYFKNLIGDGVEGIFLTTKRKEM